MTNPYLDTAIGVAVIYLIFSIMAYVIQEFWAAYRESRGRLLRDAIYELLNDNLNKGYGVLLFTHPQFDFLKKKENRLPAYLPSSNFAHALIDVIAGEARQLMFVQQGEEVVATTSLPVPTNSQELFDQFVTGVGVMKNSNLKILLQNIVADSSNVEQLKQNLEKWYNEYMDRVTGWYKSKVNYNLRWIGFILAVVFNVHALFIITKIYGDRQLRDRLVQAGEYMVDNREYIQSIYNTSFQNSLAQLNEACVQRMQQAPDDTARLILMKQCDDQRMALADSFTAVRRRQMAMLADTIKALELPVGWRLLSSSNDQAASGISINSFNKGWWWWLIGWLISGFAISAGAPFWFQLLNRLVNVRRTGIKPAAKEK